LGVKILVCHSTLLLCLGYFTDDAAVVATKFMPSRMQNGATLDGIRQQLSESLERLDCGHVDLYYMHRVCTKVPIEQIAQSMKQLQVKIQFTRWLWLQ
jgi:aryl-alcohol dehydrogenase-like predicted oxidoreductase